MYDKTSGKNMSAFLFGCKCKNVNDESDARIINIELAMLQNQNKSVILRDSSFVLKMNITLLILMIGNWSQRQKNPKKLFEK